MIITEFCKIKAIFLSQWFHFMNHIIYIYHLHRNSVSSKIDNTSSSYFLTLSATVFFIYTIVWTRQWWHGTKYMSCYFIINNNFAEVAVLPPKEPWKSSLIFWHFHLMIYGFNITSNCNLFFPEHQQYTKNQNYESSFTLSKSKLTLF